MIFVTNDKSAKVLEPRKEAFHLPTFFIKGIAHEIKFKDSELSQTKHDLDLKDLVDALTGAPLDTKLGLYQCRRCKVFYQTGSYEVIRSENGGRCVSCLHVEIESVSERAEQRGRNVDVNVITLQNYRNFIGRVITFEGAVQTVLISRRGTDYAVMFEKTSWIKGFKMVIFRGDVSLIGGSSYLFNMVGRLVRVRGLLVHHNRFGYQIIVSDRSMILSVT